MAVELVILDCDGVLVDSEPIANRVLSEALTQAGFPVDYETAVRWLVGRSFRRCLELIEERFGRPLPDGFAEAVQARTFEAFRAGLTPVPGAVEAVRRLKAPYCVASSGAVEKMKVTLGLTGLWPLVEGRVFSADQVAHGKPAPDLFLFAAARMGVHPRACVVVEDSVPGVEAATAAGMTVLGYVGGSHPAPLAEAGAATFDDMSRLPALVDALQRSSGAAPD